MARVLIVGAGECGLPLALRLVRGGQSVSLMTNRDAASVLAGAITSTQVKFGPTLALEADAGLAAWQTIAPKIRGIRFRAVVDRQVVMSWAGRLSHPAQSVDQRTVFAHWLAEFESAGGDLHIVDPVVAEVDRRAAGYDLTVVTRAAGELSTCFAADSEWTLPTEPARRLAAFYWEGVDPDPDRYGTYVALPGLGEFVSYPGLTGPPGQERPCEMVLFEAIPGGGLDAFETRLQPNERLRTASELLQRYLPSELAERYRNMALADSGGTLVGGITPVMRQPIGVLPSGTPVLGGGDVVCRMDPGGAQGANSAAHCAVRYAEAILNNADGTYDPTWMAAAAAPWLVDIAHPAARWTSALLDPSPAMLDSMAAAQFDSRRAGKFADTFANPSTMDALFMPSPLPAAD